MICKFVKHKSPVRKQPYIYTLVLHAIFCKKEGSTGARKCKPPMSTTLNVPLCVPTLDFSSVIANKPYVTLKLYSELRNFLCPAYIRILIELIKTIYYIHKIFYISNYYYYFSSIYRNPLNFTVHREIEFISFIKSFGKAPKAF